MHPFFSSSHVINWLGAENVLLWLKLLSSPRTVLTCCVESVVLLALHVLLVKCVYLKGLGQLDEISLDLLADVQLCLKSLCLVFLFKRLSLQSTLQRTHFFQVYFIIHVYIN